MTVDHIPITGFELRSDAALQPQRLADQGWVPAVVPGGVHESLMAAGVLADPYVDENEQLAAWVENEVWWYRAAFPDPTPDQGDRVRLVFHGLDTVCTVFLNGDEVLRRSNMFCPGEVDVTGRLHADNVVHLRFEPPLAGLVPASPRPGPPPTVDVTERLIRAQRRKATYSWGWDFAARLPSIGLWQPVELAVERRAALRGHLLRTVSIGARGAPGAPGPDDRTNARLRIQVEADAFGPEDGLTAEVTMTGPDGTIAGRHALALKPTGGGHLTAETEVDLEAAQLWWTHDLGPQPLYDVTITLLDAAGERLDSRTDRIGIRTIALDRSADHADDAAEGSRLFRFVLNGFPIFARGANWVPASMLPGSVSAETLAALVGRAVAGRMNMLRIWGGGYYEHDRFYELCDEQGVLVWQDFMFACIDYPSDDARLSAEVEEEAVFQVRRLRNHACLALWCGNNEVEAIHAMTHGNAEAGGDWGYSFFHQLLPRVVEAHDPGADYWPGSPWSELGARETNGVRDGDRHAWEVWHGLNIGAGGPTAFASHGEAVHFSRYAYDTGRFISEFGIHASPELATLQRWTQPGSLELHSPAFDHRNKDNPKNKGDDLMEYETGLPTDLASYVELSMACQAEGLKFGIEHYRRRQPSNSGTLVWQFNDPWPGITWSVVDYDGVPKASYYALKRAYAPVLASFMTTDDSLELWLTNSGRTDVAGALRVEVVMYAGASVIDENITVAAAAGESKRVWSAPLERVVPGPDRVAWVSSPDGLVEPNRAFFGRLKEQAFGPHHVEVTAARDGRPSGLPVELDVTSHGYNYFTRVDVPYTGVSLSTNYLDLRPGQVVTVAIHDLPPDVDAATLGAVSYRGASTPRST